MSELNFKGKEFVYNHHLTVPHRPLMPDADKSAGAARLDGWSRSALVCTGCSRSWLSCQ